jgi:LysM repeat protein
MSRFKIIVFLMAMSMLAAIFATAWWFYVRVIAPDAATESQITEMRGRNKPPPDPGIKRFDKAVESIEADDIAAGRSALYELLRTFPNSSRVAESKRIIGEMNMDMLFDAELNPLRKDYIVQPGDSLNLIARKQQTTVECILRANGLQSGILQPGDHLNVFPLDFTLVVDVDGKTVTLMRVVQTDDGPSERFFREYPALDVKLPVPRAPYEAKVSDKPAWVNNKRVGVLSSDFMTAEKWISVEGKGQNSFNIRALPKAKPVEPAATTSKSSGKKLVKKTQEAETLPGTTVDEDEINLAPPVALSGVFLPSEDIEELFTIIRTGTPVKVIR